MPRDLPRWDSLELVAILLVVLAVLGGTTAIVAHSLPLLTDTLAGVGAGTMVGGLITYRWERAAVPGDRPNPNETAWIVPRWTWIGAGTALFVHAVIAVV